MARPQGRSPEALRSIQIEPGFSNQAASVLFRLEKTVVNCTALIEPKLPNFAEPGSGWISAEYAMLPASTQQRIQREKKGKSHDRGTEIQRMIGRSLRGAVNLRKMGEIALYIDCDVLSADGGTRCASISGAYLAVVLALRRLEKEGKVKVADVIKHEIAAVSVGFVKGQLRLDLEFVEDSKAEVDLNLVMTGDKRIIEIQGTGEYATFGIHQTVEMINLGYKGIEEILKAGREFLAKVS